MSRPMGEVLTQRERYAEAFEPLFKKYPLKEAVERLLADPRFAQLPAVPGSDEPQFLERLKKRYDGELANWTKRIGEGTGGAPPHPASNPDFSALFVGGVL